jgi:hypothetical protein
MNVYLCNYLFMNELYASPSFPRDCYTNPVYHNFVLPHASLWQALAEPVATNGCGSAKLWQPRTPAMAAGLADHVWSLREVLMFRVPPWPQMQTV